MTNDSHTLRSLAAGVFSWPVLIAVFTGCVAVMAHFTRMQTVRAAIVDAQTELVTEAEFVHAIEQPFDLRQPFDRPKPFLFGQRSRAGQIYFAACILGDKPSCWFADDFGIAKATQAIEANCSGGDYWSCRATKATMGIEDANDWERSRCAFGFPYECWLLETHSHDDVESGAAHTRALALARDGCRRGLSSDCSVLTLVDGRWSSSDASDRRFALQRFCEWRADDCETLGDEYERAYPWELDRARDAYERACQYGKYPPPACSKVGRMYLDRVVDEPVAGRGLVLLARSCLRLAKDGPLWFKDHWQCEPRADD